MHQGPEERGGGQSLSGAGGREAEGEPALSQHRVLRGLGHRGVVSGGLNFTYFLMVNEMDSLFFINRIPC